MESVAGLLWNQWQVWRGIRTSSQVQPPDPNVYDKDRGQSDEYVHELLDRAHIGPVISSSYQKLMEEAPPDWRISAFGTVQQNLRKYAKELSGVDSALATDRLRILEEFIREIAEKDTRAIPKGDVTALMEAYLGAQVYRGTPRVYMPEQKRGYLPLNCSSEFLAG